jgi:hypothetical protein
MDSVSLLEIVLGVGGLCLTSFGVGLALGLAINK